MPQVISSVRPGWAVPGASVVISGVHLPLGADGPPHVLVGPHDARVVAASRQSLRRGRADPIAKAGRRRCRIDELPGETAYIEVARVLTTGVHQVDSPIFDRRRPFVRDAQRRARYQGAGSALSREPGRNARAPSCRNRQSDVARRGPDGTLFVSSRFEGHVYRVGPMTAPSSTRPSWACRPGWRWRPTAHCSSAIDPARSCASRPTRKVETFATLPASVAAFHLALGPDGSLYVTAPTLASHDPVYRITPDRLIDVVADGFGRPQGLAFDSTGTLYVVDALAGAAGLYKVDVSKRQAGAGTRPLESRARRRRIRSCGRRGAGVERHALATRGWCKTPVKLEG